MGNNPMVGATVAVAVSVEPVSYTHLFSLRVLISIKSTMIIDGGHHGIRL